MKILFSPSEAKYKEGNDIRFDEKSFIFHLYINIELKLLKNINLL